MIYSITGWNLQENGAAKLTALLAAYTAIKLQKNTLVLQLTNPRRTTVEDILVGKQLKAQRIDVLDTFSYSDEGIDALLRQARYTKVTEETVQTSVTPLLTKDKLLDIVRASKKADFELETDENPEALLSCIRSIEKFYDYVFVLLPEENREFCAKLYGLFECNNLKCVQQLMPPRQANNKDFTFVIPEYENRSTITATAIKKALGVKSLKYFTRNVAFHDAAATGDVLEFVKKNLNNEKSDDNWYLFECLHQFFSAEDKKEPEEDFEHIEPAQRLCALMKLRPEFEPVDDDKNVQLTEKKRFLRKKKVTLTIDRDTDFTTLPPDEPKKKRAKKVRPEKKGKPAKKEKASKKHAKDQSDKEHPGGEA